MNNVIELRPTIWVCFACGKASPDKYGHHPDSHAGWDESCMLNSEECFQDKVVFKGSIVYKVLDGGLVPKREGFGS